MVRGQSIDTLTQTLELCTSFRLRWKGHNCWLHHGLKRNFYTDYNRINISNGRITLMIMVRNEFGKTSLGLW